MRQPLLPLLLVLSTATAARCVSSRVVTVTPHAEAPSFGSATAPAASPGAAETIVGSAHLQCRASLARVEPLYRKLDELASSIQGCGLRVLPERSTENSFTFVLECQSDVLFALGVQQPNSDAGAQIAQLGAALASDGGFRHVDFGVMGGADRQRFDQRRGHGNDHFCQTPDGGWPGQLRTSPDGSLCPSTRRPASTVQDCNARLSACRALHVGALIEHSLLDAHYSAYTAMVAGVGTETTRGRSDCRPDQPECPDARRIDVMFRVSLSERQRSSVCTEDGGVLHCIEQCEDERSIVNPDAGQTPDAATSRYGDASRFVWPTGGMDGGLTTADLEQALLLPADTGVAQ